MLDVRSSGKFVNEVAPDNLSTALVAGGGFRVHKDVLPSLSARLTTFSPSYLLGHVEAEENVLLRSLNLASDVAGGTLGRRKMRGRRGIRIAGIPG